MPVPASYKPEPPASMRCNGRDSDKRRSVTQTSALFKEKLMASAPTFLFFGLSTLQRSGHLQTQTQADQYAVRTAAKKNSNFMQPLPTQTQSSEPRLNSRIRGLRELDHNKLERSKKTTRDGDPQRKQRTQDTRHHQVRMTQGQREHWQRQGRGTAEAKTQGTTKSE